MDSANMLVPASVGINIVILEAKDNGGRHKNMCTWNDTSYLEGQPEAAWIENKKEKNDRVMGNIAL